MPSVANELFISVLGITILIKGTRGSPELKRLREHFAPYIEEKVPEIIHASIGVERNGVDSVISYGDREAHIEFRSQWPNIEHFVQMVLIQLRPKYFFLHAASISQGDECVLLIGSTGAGKSTLARTLTSWGFTIECEDVTPIDVRTQSAHRYRPQICSQNEDATRRSESFCVDAGGYESHQKPISLLIYLGNLDDLSVMGRELTLRTLESKSIGEQFRAWRVLCRLCLGDENAERNPSSTGPVLIPRFSFNEALTMRKLTPSTAVRVFSKHLLYPAPDIGEVIRQFSPVLARLPMFNIIHGSPAQRAESVIKLFNERAKSASLA